MSDAAQSYPLWHERWRQYKASGVVVLMHLSMARVQRLQEVVAAGAQARMGLHGVLKMTEPEWKEFRKEMMAVSRHKKPVPARARVSKTAAASKVVA